jgi:NAD(P)-dependent dehydrogenase (short-subunit alcohol dehydrogenase family)
MTETTGKISPDYHPAPNLLAGRVVLVTGAGRGLGRAVALACAAHGATLALLGRTPQGLEETYDAIQAAGGAEPAIIPLDLATAGDREFETLAQLLRRDLSRLDALVHCAAHFTPLSPLRDQSLEQWQAHLRANLAAPFALTRACLPLLAAAPDGAVVFTGETHGRRPAAYWGAFAVAKAGLSTLARIWADELEHAGRPRFHVLIPGPVATRQRSLSHPGEDRSALRRPEEAAAAYLRLLGPEGRGLSGKTLEIVTHATGTSGENGLN